MFVPKQTKKFGLILNFLRQPARQTKFSKIQRALQSALIKMETQGSFLNGAGPSPPLPDATKEAEKEETREEEGGEEEQQQRVEEEDFPGEEEKKERS